MRCVCCGESRAIFARATRAREGLFFGFGGAPSGRAGALSHHGLHKQRGKEIGCDTPRDRANSPLTERWPWGPARRGAPTILPAVLPAVLLSNFGAGGPRAFVTLSRKLHICMSRKPGLAGACRYYLRLGAWARRRLSSDTTRTSSRFSPDLSAAASIPTGSMWIHTANLGAAALWESHLRAF